MGKKLHYNKLLELVKSLGMPKDDFAVFGSGPMFPHGLKQIDRDIDIIARGKAWYIAAKFKRPVPDNHNMYLKVSYFQEHVEIFSGWAPGLWHTDSLIDSAEVYDGIRFVRLEKVLLYKKMLNRKKDLVHIALIEKYLGPPFITYNSKGFSFS